MGKSVNSKEIVRLYTKRMQIEESFRDLKNTRTGLGARNLKRIQICSWNILMLIASMVQIVYWMIGAMSRENGLQKQFQSNSCYQSKVFSDFYLGKLILWYYYKDQTRIRKKDIVYLMSEVAHGF